MKNKPNRNNHFNQPSTNAAHPNQPAPHAQTRPVSALPAAAVLRTFQQHLAAKSTEIQPLDPELPKLLEMYAGLLQLVTLERINSMIEQQIQTGVESHDPAQLLRLMIQGLINQERTFSRRSREESARQREIRRQEKEANDVPASPVAPISDTAVETQSKDARVPGILNEFLPAPSFAEMLSSPLSGLCANAPSGPGSLTALAGCATTRGS